MKKARGVLDTKGVRMVGFTTGYAHVVKKILGGVLPREQAKDANRTGGYLCVADLDTGLPMLVIPVGEFISVEKAVKYLRLAQEKARRLAQMHYDRGDISSWQSRDSEVTPAEERMKFGGAIIGTPHYSYRLIYSFSGFTEKGDECASAVAAMCNCDMSERLLKKLAKISGNPDLLLIKRNLPK